MRLVFLGSPPFAVSVLETLVAGRHRPFLVVTRPDRPRGRGRKVQPSPVAQIASREGIEVLQPKGTRDPELLDRLRQGEPDVFLVASFGELLREEFLAIPKQACLNVHPSLLPRHRGATPIQAAILAGDAETGVSIQRVVLELDAGDVLVAKRTAILPAETAGELAERLAGLAAQATLEALDHVADGTAVYTPQDPSRATFCRKLDKAHGRLDWSSPAPELERRVRAMNPWPAAQTTLPSGIELQVLRCSVLDAETGAEPGEVVEAGRRLVVATARGCLELVEVKPAGKRAMAAAEFLRGARLEEGARLGGGG